MKKLSILLYLLFLVVLCNNASAQAARCGGTVSGCAETVRQNQLACTGSSTATSGGGCAWAAATNSCTGTANACSSLTANGAGVCNNIPDCFWTSVGNANQNAFVTTLCNALKIVTGSGGKAFAAFAIISCGIGFFTGKISWGLMIGITCGIAAMFGAPTIVAAISGGNAVDCAAQ